MLELNSSGDPRQIVNEYRVKTIKCTRCNDDVPPRDRFCGRCGLAVSLQEQYVKEKDLEERNRSLELKIDSIETIMNRRFTQVMLMIQQNPHLASIKPEILITKYNSVNVVDDTSRDQF